MRFLSSSDASLPASARRALDWIFNAASDSREDESRRFAVDFVGVLFFIYKKTRLEIPVRAN